MSDCTSGLAPPAQWLHEQVCAQRRRTRARNFDTRLAIAFRAAAAAAAWVTIAPRDVAAAEQLDHHLRTELAIGLIRELPRTASHPLLVVVRPGPLTVFGDGDGSWLAAWHAAIGACGLVVRPEAAIISRYGFCLVSRDLVVATSSRRHLRQRSR